MVSGQRWTVLVAEDDKDLSLLIRKILRFGGYDVLLAGTGVESLEILRRNNSRIFLLLDYFLPDMKAGELLSKLNEEDIYIPFMIVTGSGNEKIAVEMMKKGARDYIVKENGYLDLLVPTLKKNLEQIQMENLSSAYQDAMHKAEHRFRILVEKSPIGIFISQENRIIYSNPKFTEITGYSPDDFMSMAPADVLEFLTGKNDKGLLRALSWNMVPSGNTSPQIKISRKDGRDVYLAIFPTDTEIDGKPSKIFSFLDITECKTSEKRVYETYRDMVWRLGRTSEDRDYQTGMHVLRISFYCALLGMVTGLSSERCEMLLNASMLHDIGKIGIPDEILLKDSQLTDAEFQVMKSHVKIGGKILSGSSHSLMEMARDVAMYHHENWDGSGYYYELKETDIPVEARICAICDNFDALTTARPYKEAWGVDTALGWIQEMAGKKFDPGLVNKFMKIMPRIVHIKELYSDQSDIEKVTIWA